MSKPSGEREGLASEGAGHSPVSPRPAISSAPPLLQRSDTERVRSARRSATWSSIELCAELWSEPALLASGGLPWGRRLAVELAAGGGIRELVEARRCAVAAWA